MSVRLCGWPWVCSGRGQEGAGRPGLVPKRRGFGCPFQEEAVLLPTSLTAPLNTPSLNLEKGTRACECLKMAWVVFWTNGVALASFHVPFRPAPCEAVAGAAGRWSGV